MYVMKIAPGKAPEIVPCDCSLKALQSLVGGYVEPVPVARDYCLVIPGMLMLVNDCGKLQNLHYNPIATHITALFDNSPIVGTALLVKVSGDKFTGFDDAEADELTSFMEYDLNIDIDIERRANF